jgi:hypothetical protein
MNDEELTEKIDALARKLADVQQRIGAVRNSVRYVRIHLRERA